MAEKRRTLAYRLTLVETDRAGGGVTREIELGDVWGVPGLQRYPVTLEDLKYIEGSPPDDHESARGDRAHKLAQQRLPKPRA